MKYFLYIVSSFLLLSCCASLSFAQDNKSADSEGTVWVYGRDHPIGKAAIIKSVAKPAYTKQARKNKVEGTVELRLVLASSGKVTKITPTRTLPDGLTEEAMKAARNTRFEPAKMNGRDVSMYFYMDYHFSLSRGVTVLRKSEP